MGNNQQPAVLLLLGLCILFLAPTVSISKLLTVEAYFARS
jgi:hypothetical protein